MAFLLRSSVPPYTLYDISLGRNTDIRKATRSAQPSVEVQQHYLWKRRSSPAEETRAAAAATPAEAAVALLPPPLARHTLDLFQFSNMG